MPQGLSFELRIEERSARRVMVSVLLAPDAGGSRLDGVALQLVGRTGEPIGVQMVLPIAGDLRQAMLSTVELKTDEDIPLGARVVGAAWSGCDQREASIPTDPFTELEVHMRARRRISGEQGEVELERLCPEDREALAQDFPWIDDPRLPEPVAELTVFDDEDTIPEDEMLDELVENLGLDEESADWLKELLEEDDAVSG